MKGGKIEKLEGKYCKIVTKEPGEKRANVVTGTLENVDTRDGFILVDSEQGLGALRINTIIAIKPSQKNKPKHTKKRNLKKDKKANIGIGTLVVFIAMVLVAAVAAMVIIDTSETLQNRAEAVSKQSIHEVSSGIKVVSSVGYTDEDKTKIEYLALSVSPRAGSYDLDLNSTNIYIQRDNLTVLSLNFNRTQALATSVDSDGIFHSLDLQYLNSTNYGVVAIRDKDNSINKSFGIGTNDLVVLMINLTDCFQTDGGLLTSEDFNIRIVPEVGAAAIKWVDAPNAFENRIVIL
ncbi:MAG: archaellin/type IV pilin N-terminal domain-containing protein [Candidatus Thermoplasmatota archaeon]